MNNDDYREIAFLNSCTDGTTWAAINASGDYDGIVYGIGPSADDAITDAARNGRVEPGEFRAMQIESGAYKEIERDGHDGSLFLEIDTSRRPHVLRRVVDE